MGRPKKITNNSQTAIQPAESTALEANPSEMDAIKLACTTVGLTLEKSLQVILEAQSATKTTVDKYGEEHTEPDHDKRLRGAHDHLEIAGYLKKGNIVTDNSKHTHVVYSWQPVQVINTNLPTARIDVD